MTTPIFYHPSQSVPNLAGFSPSAGKPQRFVELMQHYAYHDYGGNKLGPVIPVTQDDLYRVHSSDYVDAVFAGREPNGFGNYDLRVPEACLWTIGSLLAAARWALQYPLVPACSPSSGFHHAGFNEGGGYCTFNGLMVVAAMLLAENPALRIGILDCDFHYGDGSADILSKKPELAEHVIHCSSGQHFHGDSADEADEFFLWLEESINEINTFGCDIVLYQAGADMHIQDPLGGLLDDAQMRQRDRSVFRKIKSGISWTLAGGYRSGADIFSDPVLQTHRNTLQESSGSHQARRAWHPNLE